MIDTCEIIVTVKHLPFGQELQKVNEDGSSQVVLTRNRVKVVLKGGKRYVHVRSCESGSKILIEGSVAKFLYGHNIYGPGNPVKAIQLVVRYVLDQLGIKPSAEELIAIKSGEIIINRVDVVGNAVCATENEKQEVLKSVFNHINATQRNVSRYGYETVYVDQSSRSKSIKFYDKQAQLDASPTAKRRVLQRLSRLSDSEKCLDNLQRLVRIEITYRARFLKENGLNLLKNWQENTLRCLFFKDYSALKISGEYSVPVLDLLKDIKEAAYRQTFYAYLNGAPLRDILKNRQTYSNHKKYFRENHGVDIDLPLVVAVGGKEMGSVLSVDALIFSRPECFLPLKK